MKMLKKNYKFILGIIVGLIIAGTTAYAATVITSKDISYDNTTSKLSSTNVKDALDELSTKTELKNRDNIVEGYTYNQTSGASNYCITGEESTCVKTDCYKDTTANSCKAGDIIKYKVNDTDIVTFHVMYDNGTTMTMQSQKNTIRNTPWYDKSDDNSKGPITVITALEQITRGWSNVNDQTYTMGTTVFKINAFTGCNSYNSCTTNTYTLGSRTAKARMITLQEAFNLGCTSSSESCPIWMYNYLVSVTDYGGTKNDNILDSTVTYVYNYGYWTMSSINDTGVWYILIYGSLGNSTTTGTGAGARAVVVISK